MQVKFTERALQDLMEIADYLIEKAGVDTAFKITDEIERVIINVLAENPEIGTQAFDNLKKILFFPAGKYSIYQIYYEINTSHIEIYRVLHGKRDITNLLR